MAGSFWYKLKVGVDPGQMIVKHRDGPGHQRNCILMQLIPSEDINAYLSASYVAMTS